MGIEVIIAKTHEEKEEYFRVIKRVYCEQYGYLSLPYDKFDAIATFFLAVQEGTLNGIAAARIIEPNKLFANSEDILFGLPMEEEFDLSSLKSRMHDKFVQVSKSAAPVEFQKSGGIVHVWRAIYQYSRSKGYTHWLNSANPETDSFYLAQSILRSARNRGLFHQDIKINPKSSFKMDCALADFPTDEAEIPPIIRLYERMNQFYIGEPAFYKEANMCAIPMVLELDKIAKKELYEKPGKFRF